MSWRRWPTAESLMIGAGLIVLGLWAFGRPLRGALVWAGLCTGWWVCELVWSYRATLTTWAWWARVGDLLVPWLAALASWISLGILGVVFGQWSWTYVLNALVWTLLGWHFHRTRMKIKRQFSALQSHLRQTVKSANQAHQQAQQRRRWKRRYTVGGGIPVDAPLFCPKCGIDLQANPDAQVELLDIEEPFMEIQGRCNCGAHSFWTYWPDQQAAAGKVWMEGTDVKGLGW